ncbi:hypothetical protein [Eleftheria terrae]|uniref:hypothetical protein n=1 Tax=Eleftheria terrae TaxID=1597781 RepID=UPI00263B0D70|nr:hypothetical protein [Eleftheria terrae]WKB51486.1 hypothetical protein N7L95_16970 [Eleftheria terrae]
MTIGSIPPQALTTPPTADGGPTPGSATPRPAAPGGGGPPGLPTRVLVKNRDGLQAIHSARSVAVQQALQTEIAKAKAFEIGAALAVLDHPGAMGAVFDRQARKLDTLLGALFQQGSPLGQRQVQFQGQQRALADVFAETLLRPLSPTSDQIGRCTDPALRDAMQASGMNDLQFMRADGLAWLRGKLSTASVDNGQHQTLPGYSFQDMLTKIRATSAFGTTVWQLMSTPELRRANAAPLAELMSLANPQLAAAGSSAVDGLNQRFTEFQSRTRNGTFDDPVARARRERVPLVNGQPVQTWQYESAARYGLGFGQVIQPGGVQDPAQAAALQAALDQHGGVNGIPREGQPIQDGRRPGTLSEAELGALLAPFENAGLRQALQAHELQHGTGVNRWEPYGTFADDSAGKGFPSAGAQSGGTCDILLALHCMSGQSLYGNAQEVLPATVGIAAFMNFGAYHTFAETLPIGMAMAANQKAYVPHVGQRQEGLYEDFYRLVRQHVGGEAHAAVQPFKQAFDSVSQMQGRRQPDPAIELYLTSQQYQQHFPQGGAG